MVVRRRKKVQKLRGSKTHGWGSKKKHRGGGSRGGRGRAGLFKHKKSLVKKLNITLGRMGFKRPRAKKEKSITLRDLDVLAEKIGKDIDLSKLGYKKIISSGKLTKPLRIKVAKVTEKAKKKIEEIGGRILSD